MLSISNYALLTFQWLTSVLIIPATLVESVRIVGPAAIVQKDCKDQHAWKVGNSNNINTTTAFNTVKIKNNGITTYTLPI